MKVNSFSSPFDVSIRLATRVGTYLSASERNDRPACADCIASGEEKHDVPVIVLNVGTVPGFA